MRKEVREKMERYFMDNFCEECVTEGMDFKEAVNIALAEYRKQGLDHPSNVRRHPNAVDRLGDHLRGLPSPFYPDYANYLIEEILREWGIITEKTNSRNVAKAVDLWWVKWADFILKNATLDDREV